jgi:hypothetical protein
MADWGALLATENGAPFITPQSIPLALLSKKTVSIASGSGEITTITQAFTAGRPVIPFICTTVDCVSSYSVSGSTCTVTIRYPQATGGVAHVYFFSIFAQPLPAWGIAIWDEAGVCILTNETRVLTDIQALGTSGSDAQGGYNIRATKAGKWGILPSRCGMVTGIINSGGVRPFVSEFFFSCAWGGGSTQISIASTAGAPGGGVTDIAYHNMRNQVYALNLANYD